MTDLEKIREMLPPDTTYNAHIDMEIQTEGENPWLERVLREELFERLAKKLWYSEAAYVLFQMDRICQAAGVDVLLTPEAAKVRSWKLYDIKYYKVCRVRCLDCGHTIEHVNQTKTENLGKMLFCPCGNVGVDPSASLYRVVAKPGAYFEDLSEEWRE